MTLGMSVATFTLLHVIISLIGIASGLVVLFGLMTGRGFDRLTVLFVSTTLLTSVTGFLFPIQKITPGIVVGILSCVVLALAVVGLYIFQLRGPWRRTYVISATLALYFNVFVLIVQSFQKVPALHALAPTQSEPAFQAVQLLTLVIFIALGIVAVKRFRPAVAAAAMSAASGQ